MNNYFTRSFVFVLALVLTACNEDEKTETTPKPVYIPISEDTQMANQGAVGLATGDEENIYFCQIETGAAKLYKRNRVTSALTVLHETAWQGDGPCYSNLYVHEGYLYCSLLSGIGQGVWRMKTDGTDARRIMEDVVISCYYRDKMFYVVSYLSEKRGLYSMNFDGSQKKQLLEGVVSRRVMVKNDLIYYLTCNYDHNYYHNVINTCDLDGLNHKVIHDVAGNINYLLDADKIYCLERDALVSMNLDGSNLKTLLSSLPQGFFNVKDDLLILSFPEGNNRYRAGIYKYMDGYKMPILILDQPAYFINLVGDDQIVYCCSIDEDANIPLYLTDFNGSKNEKLSK